MTRSTVDFIGIGAQRSGTSWLYNQFIKSDQIEVFPLKEIHYFDRSTTYDSPNFLSKEKLIHRLLDLKWVLKSTLLIKKKRKHFNWYWNFLFSNYNDDWYLSLFENIDKCKGEITPSYSILEENDIIKMRTLLGSNTKLIFMIRNPVDRAWSSYKYWHRGKYVKNLDINHAKRFFLSDHQKLRSDYIRTLENYKKHFDSVCVCFFDAILDNPQGLLEGILEYLELDEKEVYTMDDVGDQVNRSKNKDMPDEIFEFLNTLYKDEIRKLIDFFGSYTANWTTQDNRHTNGNKPVLIF